MVASQSPLLSITPAGLYCREGDFHIDPWRPVPRALITHGHADHARWGCERYLATAMTGRLIKRRYGDELTVQSAAYGESILINGVRVSFHPAGHILGSAQIRIEHHGRVWVVSGDYKTVPDPTCQAFEPLRCQVFITESTFGLPIFKWARQSKIMAKIQDWWRQNQEAGQTSLLFAYALGKAQRILAGLDPAIGPVLTHGAVENINAGYREASIGLAPTQYLGKVEDQHLFSKALVLAPPSADTPAWLRKFKAVSRAFASGWMQIRGHRRRRALDRGFVLSDHCDWPGLLEAVRATEAETVWVMHGYTVELVRWLRENGVDARSVNTPAGGSGEDQTNQADGAGRT